MAKKTAAKKGVPMKKLLLLWKWFVDQFLPWYNKNYGGQPNVKNETPPPPPPPPPDLP